MGIQAEGKRKAPGREPAKAQAESGGEARSARLRDRLAGFLSRVSIRARMILIYALILNVFFAISLLFFLHIRDHYKDSLQRQTSDLLYMASHYLTTSMKDMEQETYHLVTDHALQTDMRAYLDARTLSLKVSLWSGLNDLILQYAGNSSYISSITMLSGGEVSTRGRTSFTEATEDLNAVAAVAEGREGAAVWLVSQADPATVLLARNVREIRDMSLKTMGQVIYRIRLDKMAAEFLSGHEYLSPDTPLVISDPESGRILYPVEGEDAALYRMAAAVPDGAFERLRTAQGASYLVLSQRLPSSWRCSLLVSYDELTAPIRRIFLLTILIMLCVTVAMIGGSSVFAVAFTKHFSVLQRKMERVEANNLEPMETETDYTLRRDEIGYLHQAFDRMVRKLRRLIDENYTNQLLLRDARIHSLEEQLNPHFLYNTLDLIYWDAKMAGQDNICAVTDALGSLLRASMQKNRETDTLREELELADCYMEIQRQRFGERLVYEKAVDETLLNAAVPVMCIQPLLENAMAYGVENSAEPCVVRLTAGLEAGDLRLSVMNEGSSFPEELLRRLESGELKPQKHGIALINIDTRVRLLYGEAYGLRFHNRNNATHEETAEVEIRLPLKEEKE